MTIYSSVIEEKLESFFSVNFIEFSYQKRKILHFLIFIISILLFCNKNYSKFIEIKFFKVPTLFNSVVVAFFHSYSEVCVMRHAK